MSRSQIDNLDTKILQMLVDNGRKPFLEIARECGVSGAAIHQRIAKLQATNILEGSRALIKPATLGYDTCAFIGVFLKEPDKFDQVVDRLKEVPEVVECHYTTGQYDMLVKVYARDNEHLLHLIHEKLQPMGLLRTETLVSFREVFSRALPVAPHHYAWGLIFSTAPYTIPRQWRAGRPARHWLVGEGMGICGQQLQRVS